MHASGIILIENSALVCEGSGILYGFLVWSEAATEEITIYDGLDVASGRKIIRSGIDDYTTLAPNFIPGIHFGTGLYVVLSGNVKSASIRFSEFRKSEAVPESASDEFIAAFQ